MCTPVCVHNMVYMNTTACQHVSPCVNMVWTLLCEHVCVNCFFKCIVPLYVHAQCKFIYIFMYYTAICILPCVTLCEHCVNTTVWTSICEYFFKHIVPCMCMYMYCTVTCILTCVSICYHVAKFVNVLTCMYACMSMYIMTVCLIIKELVTKVKVSRSPCMYTCVLTLP